MFFQIFMPCYFGNELIEISNKLSTSIFHSNWTQKSRNYKTAVKLFLENAKHPLEIEAFGLIGINFGSFTSICNSAYSLCAVFKNAF